jgi:Plasmid pRiA4b ORF-3-like protein
MSHSTSSAVFQLRVVLCGVSPLVWRRLLVPADIALTNLHRVLQIAFGWSDFYLYTFHFHGRTVGRDTGDPHVVQLSDLALHRGERFRYRYNFFAPWECDVRLELILPQPASPVLPYCVAGRNPAPDEEEGGAWHYQQLQDHHRFPPTDALSVLAETIHSVLQRGDRAAIDLEELEPAQERVDAYLKFRERKFQRQQVNAELSQLLLERRPA